jgi:SOS-response transcriptional repressor LexA
MEPRFINGQIVFIRQQNILENGEIGIFLLDGEAYIKKLQNDSNGKFLISLNKDYKPIPIEEHSEFSILGKVIG